jgi:DDE superfamily endonuclease
LVIDDTGNRKDDSATAHVARQYLGSVGKTDNGIVAVTSLWADARCYWLLHLVPYTPASRLAKGKSDPGFRTKPQLAAGWSAPPSRPASRFGRWWPTASTATTPALSKRLAPRR